MRIILSDQTIINLKTDEVVIVFDNDEERKTMAYNLSNMPDEDHVRLYAIFKPAVTDGKELLDQSLKLLGYEKGIDSFS